MLSILRQLINLGVTLQAVGCEKSTRNQIGYHGWLIVGALALGASAALVAGSGTAQADTGARSPSSAGASPVGGPSKSPVRAAAERGLRSAAATRTGPATTARQMMTRDAVTGTAAGANCPGCGSQQFSYTGSNQTWTVPTGVISAYVTLAGGNGGDAPTAPPTPDDPPGPTISGGSAVPIGATVSFSGGSLLTPITSLFIVVGGNGLPSSNKDPGPGGYNGGGSGGSGSISDSGTGGGGGGGRTDVDANSGGQQAGGLSVGYILVAGGGGGGGGSNTSYNSPSCCGGAGGVGGGGAPTPGGIWPGGSGVTASSNDAGSGGAGGTTPGLPNTSGQDAETLSGNSGGGGGGGGWYPGWGGQAGQSGLFGGESSGGGGGGGASYANPSVTTNASALPSLESANGFVSIQWVDIVTTALGSLKYGKPTNRQLSAIYGASADPLSWQVSAGALPKGVALSNTGQLTGKPTQPQSYSFEVTVTGPNDTTSVMTYSGIVCGRRCDGRGRR